MRLTKNSNISIAINLFAATTFLCGGILFLFWGFDYFKSELGVKKYAGLASIFGGICFLVFSVFLFLKRKKRFHDLLFTASISVFLYLMIEMIFYLSICYKDYKTLKQFDAFSYPATIYDSIRGFRWQKGTHRTIKIIKGEIITDNSFTPNNKGYHCNRDFFEHKKDTSSKRIIIFGDSFTGGEFTKEVWADKTQELLNSTHQKIELYPFALSAIGVMNWHSIFFKELIPNYDFDAVMLAVFQDDLYRGFSVIHSNTQYGSFKRFDAIPAKTEVLSLPKIVDIKTPDEINSIITQTKNGEYPKKITRRFFAKPTLYFLELFLRLPGKFLIQKSSSKQEIISENYFSKRYGAQKFHQLKDIINWCHAHHKKLILCAMPQREELINYNTKKLYPKSAQDLKNLSQFYHLNFINGFDAFKGLSEKQIQQHWLHYDGHWNQKGSDRFAVFISKYISGGAKAGSSFSN
ncbi:MAG: hypothetical protein NTX03_06245 [Bacteroidetes bacterium]|nr:hypothetical protein [Bacteroidota bacterium]